MKIMFVSAASSIHTIRWVNALSERGNQVVLVSLPNHKPDFDSINHAVKVIFLPLSGTKGYYLNASYIKKVYVKINPDIVNVHYASGYGTLVRVARIPGVILSVWGSDVYDFPYQGRLKMWIIKKNLLYAKNLASTSYAMAKQVEHLIGTNNITITPFGVDTALFRKMPRISNEFFTVGIVKTLSPKYGIDTVIKAFSIFSKKLPEKSKNIRLLIYGKGEEERVLQKLCTKEQIENIVDFKGYIPNNKVPKALAEMDICCFGSRWDSESFGVAAVEAMACEVPVIATDVDGFREVVEDGVTGFIVPRDCPESMADCLLKLYQSVDLRRSMGENGRKRVLELYDWEQNVKTMMEFYIQKRMH